MEFEQILKLIERVSESKLDSFSYEQNGTKLRLEKKKQKIQINGMPEMAAEQSVQADGSLEGSAAAGSSDSETRKSGTEIKSPLVGVFYVAPSEDAAPFVSVGDRVKKGQVVGIVEAMKLMNEITSDCDGVIREVCADNAQAVEYGQPLFRVEED